jgi:hypothetical protein
MPAALWPRCTRWCHRIPLRKETADLVVRLVQLDPPYVLARMHAVRSYHPALARSSFSQTAGNLLRLCR